MSFSKIKLLINKKNNPIGIPNDHINFSILYQDSTHVREQTAYRILIASDETLLAKNKGDIFDSGRINSKQNLNIPYTGKALPELTLLHCKVIAWATDTEQSSACGTFVVATKPKGDWIWKTAPAVPNDYTKFKREFTLSKQVSSAYITISAHNYYKLQVNGQSVGGYVSPTTTNPQKNKLFLTYSVPLKMGQNCFDIVVHYLGGNGQNYINGHPGLRCECKIIYADGTEEIIRSDSSWLFADKTPYESGTAYQQHRRMSAIEIYDEANCPTTWQPVKVVNQACEMEMLFPQQISEGAIEREILPTIVEQPDSNVTVFDAGLIVSGWVKLTLNSPIGTRIRVRYSEDLDELSRVKHNVCNEKSEYYYDEYIKATDATEEWMPCFSYKAFRYYEVTGEKLMPSQAKTIAAHTELDYVGGFNCDNPLLNQIYDACIQTQKNNVVGLMVDCPHREQAQYLADSDVQAETFSYFFNNPEVIEKVLSDFESGQLQEGTFPFVYPVNFEDKAFNRQIPEWDLHYCTLLWKLFFMTGDTSYINKYYASCKKMLDFYLNSRCDDTGLVKQSKHWHISDWPYPCIDQSGEILAVENIKIYNDTMLLAKMASLVGFHEDASHYQKIVIELRDSIRKCFYNQENGLFRDCSNSEVYSKGTNAVALEFELFEQAEVAKPIARLLEGGLETSTLLTLDLLKVLFRYGQPNAAYDILAKKDYPSWGYMIECGYKTMWEGFSDIESHCHAWNAYPARIFAEYLVGIQCTGAGFSSIDIKPFFPTDMKKLSATVSTPQGPVAVNWCISNSQLELEISVPYGICADIYLPTPNGGHEKRQAICAGKHHIVFDK